MSSSTEQMRLLELFELQASEGPCLDCYRTGESTFLVDVAADEGRWPRFSPTGVTAGFCAVHARPLRLRGNVIGALNLFRVEPGEIPDADIDEGQALADVATITILQHRAALEAPSSSTNSSTRH
jgi:GAF domain-containing protein